MDKVWFRKNITEVLQELATDVDSGLSAETVAKHLETHGPNELAEAEKQSTLGLLIEQFKNPLLIILLVGAGVSLYADHAVDAIAITVIVVINALISFAQEYNARKSMDALKDMAAPNAFVRRVISWLVRYCASIPVILSLRMYALWRRTGCRSMRPR